MARENSGIWGKVITIAITMAMLFSTGFVFSEKTAAVPIDGTDNSAPPIPPYTIWGTIYDENNIPVSAAILTITNLKTGESLDAESYENGLYEVTLDDMPNGYEIGDEIEITVVANSQTITRNHIIEHIGFGELVDIHFGNENILTNNDNKRTDNMLQTFKDGIETTMPEHDFPTNSASPRSIENSRTIFIDSPITNANAEPTPDITLVDIRCPPYFRLAFTEKENNIRLAILNGENERKNVIVDLYHVGPDGVTESFLKSVHFGAIQSGQTKTTDAFGKNEDMWTPIERGRNWIRGEIYIKGHGNERILVNEFEESFNVVPGWRPILELGPTTITEPTVWENLTVVIRGDLTVDAQLDVIKTDVLAANWTVSSETATLDGNSSHDMECTRDGEFKVEVYPTGTLNIYGKLWNNDQDNHYWFYMNGTLNIGRESPPDKPGIVENVMGSPDLSQPGGIICTTDNVRIENGAEVRNGKTHGVWLEGSDANITGAKIHDNGGNGVVCVGGAAPTIEFSNISWNCGNGIFAEDSFPIIQNNTGIVWNGKHGVFLSGISSIGNIISGNRISDNFGSGIWCDEVDYMTIASNTISRNGKNLIFSSNMESICEKPWIGTGLWHVVDNETGVAPPQNLSHSGNKCWWFGQDSTGNYDTGGRTIGQLTTSGWINLINATDASLVFWSWYETDTMGTQTDQRWVRIYSDTFIPLVDIQMFGEPMGEWIRYVVNISNCVEKELKIEFFFDSINDNENDHQGWYIDDVQVISSYPYEPSSEGHGIVYISGMTVNINNNTIDANNWNGIYCMDVSSVIVDDNVIFNNKQHGIESDALDNCYRRNKIVGGLICLNLYGVNNLVERNTISDGNTGLHLSQSASSVIYLNTIINITYGMQAIQTQNCIIFSNYLTDTGVGIFFDIVSFSWIYNNEFINDKLAGIVLYAHSNYNFVTGNAFTSTHWDTGIRIASSNNNTLDCNTMNGNYQGIKLFQANNNTLKNNSILYGLADGIFLGLSDGNLIRNNKVENHSNGIACISSNHNKIIENIVKFNPNHGIFLTSSVYNTLSNNDINGNGNGFAIYEGSNSNIIYHNTFTQNNNQAYDDTGSNQWHNSYPSGGNYWSDYTGSDEKNGPNQDINGPDGFGDTPYTSIQGGTGAQDDYPLMAIPSFGIFSIPVILGWNLISIPFACSGFPPDVLRDITGDTEWNVVRWYDSQDTDDPWKIHRIDGTANDLFNINYTMGLWVYITSIGDGFLTLEGRIPAITSIQLYTGWNLIGYPTFTEKTVANAFWGTGADHVEVFNASSPTLLSEVGPTYLMKPGEGYWVHVPADSVWTVDW